MKLLVIITSQDPETIWNGFRLANNFLRNGHTVNVFLLSKGVECDEKDTVDFKISAEIDSFLKGGNIFACGTCLGFRDKEPLPGWLKSTLDELRDLIIKSDKVLNF